MTINYETMDMSKTWNNVLTEKIRKSGMGKQYNRYKPDKKSGFFILGMPKISQNNRENLHPQFNMFNGFLEIYEQECSV